MKKNVIENIRAAAFGASGGVVASMSWDAVAAWVKSVVYDMVCR